MSYRITVYIDRSDSIGHAFIGISDGVNETIVGLYPEGQFSISEPASIPFVTPVLGVIGDDSGHPFDFSRTYEIDEAGYQKAKDFIDWAIDSDSIIYSVAGTQCSWFAANALHEAGVI